MMPRPGSGVIHPSLLADVETTVGTTRPDSAEILHPSLTRDASGTKTTYPDHADPVPVRVVPATALTSALERVTADRLAAAKQVVLAFAAGTEVHAVDRVLVNGTRMFDVLEVIGPVSYEVERRVLAEERNQ